MQLSLDDLNIGFMRRMRLIRSTSSSDAPVACFVMLCEYYKGEPNIDQIRANFSEKTPSSYDKLVRVARELGLNLRVPAAGIQEVMKFGHPFVVRFNDERFVVVEPKGGGAWVWDPVIGKKYRCKTTELKLLTSEIYELTPLWNFTENKPRPRIRWRDILGKVIGLKRSLALIFLLAVFVEIAALLSPLLIQFVTDQALPAGDKELIGVLIFGFTLLLLLRISIEGMRSWAVLVLGTTFSVQWLANVYSHLLKLPIAYFERRNLADVLSRFGVISLIQSTLTVGFLEALLDGCLVLGVFTMMLLYSAPLSLIGIAAALIYAIGRASLYKIRRQFAYLSITTHVAQQATFIESIQNISSIRTLNNSNEWIARWTGLIVAEKNADFAGARLEWAFRLARLFIFGLASVFVIGFGAIEVIDKKLSIGMLLALVAYQDLFMRRIGDFIDRIFEFKLLELQGGRLSDIILARPEPDPTPTVSDSLQNGEGVFEVKSLRYKYPDAPTNVIDGVSFKLKRGELVLIQGNGKTTLCRMLLGVSVPAGEIYLDDISARQMGWLRFRERVGGVIDGDRIFSGTIAENVAGHKRNFDLKRVAECISFVELEKEMYSLPRRFETQIKSGGRPLTGSQVQLLQLARVLYRVPEVVILDEAFSLVNEKIETAILERLRDAGTTVIYCSERTRHEKFDRHFQLINGKLEKNKEPSRDNTTNLIPTGKVDEEVKRSLNGEYLGASINGALNKVSSRD